MNTTLPQDPNFNKHNINTICNAWHWFSLMGATEMAGKSWPIDA